MYLLNRILLIIATTSTILIGLFILYCLLRFFLLIVIPEEIDHFRSWKKKRNKNIDLHQYLFNIFKILHCRFTMSYSWKLFDYA